MTPAPVPSAPQPERPATPASDPAACMFDTAPIVGLDEALGVDGSWEDESVARPEQARAHEAAAEVLADRGEWRRAYQHLRAAMALVHLDESPAVHVPEQLRREVDRLRRERAEAREQSRRDSLTATWNRRYLDEHLSTLGDDELGRAGVALVDVDHFKAVNDTYGHAVGDSVLRTLVTLMREGLDGGSFCARYGGEEFALVLPESGGGDAVATCERIRARVEGHDWSTVADGLRVTVSIGLGRPVPGDGGVTPAASVLDDVDALLYVAKRTGRNAVAHRDEAGEVRLAGAAAGRRGIATVARAAYGSPRRAAQG